ncbi:MAG: radical SAM protein [Deltaproteobacteria bacterium]|nr:radical SAM protein [Candidatus Anaeroferrophillus wilburensis]MBN2889290.1 radical SAM protein [Deltaproteobacteria bacterium]
MHYEGNIIRPPSEARSIILQATIGCSHNRCTFCPTYTGVRFRIKDEETLLADIRYANHAFPQARRLFITDGDALIIPFPRLLTLLQTINRELPRLTRIGIYASAKSLRKKSPAELEALRQEKLGIIYYGLESGDDQTLAAIDKGTTAAETLQLCRMAQDAGMKLSTTVMIGIAGSQRSLIHARLTGELLSAIDPAYVGALVTMIVPGTRLAQEAEQGLFILPDKRGLLLELREMIAATHLTRGMFMANHASNYLPIKIHSPKDREAALTMIDKALDGSLPLRQEWMRGL